MAVRFGIIFISDSIDDYKAKQLRSILERKKECNFIWFNESSAIIHNTPKVFEGESFLIIFSLVQKLLLLWYPQTNQIQYSI